MPQYGPFGKPGGGELEIPAQEPISWAHEPADWFEMRFTAKNAQGLGTTRRNPYPGAAAFVLARDSEGAPITIPAEMPPASELWAYYVPGFDGLNFVRWGMFHPHQIWLNINVDGGAIDHDNPNYLWINGTANDGYLLLAKTAQHQLLMGVGSSPAPTRAGSDYRFGFLRIQR